MKEVITIQIPEGVDRPMYFVLLKLYAKSGLGILGSHQATIDRINTYKN